MHTDTKLQGEKHDTDNFAVGNTNTQIKENLTFTHSKSTISSSSIGFCDWQHAKVNSLCLELMAIQQFLGRSFIFCLYFECESLVSMEYRVKFARSYRVSIVTFLIGKKQTPKPECTLALLTFLPWFVLLWCSVCSSAGLNKRPQVFFSWCHS